MTRIDPLKARALLLPTPLARLDPKGEAAREAEVARALGLPPLTPEDAELLDACRRQALTAHGVDHGAGEALRHPLSGERLHEADPDALRGAWQALLGDLRADTSWDALVRRLAEQPELIKQIYYSSAPDVPDLTFRTFTAALVAARAGGGDAALLLVKVGPVQAFIQASRRTRDLWAGSFLMSLLTAAACKVLIQELGPECLIAPRGTGLTLLDLLLAGDAKPGGAARPGGAVEALQPALPAKLIALVPLSRAEALGKDALRAVEEVWKDLGAEAKAELKKKVPQAPEGWDKGFDAQLMGFLQRSFAVQPWPDDAPALRAYLGALRQDEALSEEDFPDAGACYGRLTGALWSLASAADKARLPPPHAGDDRRKCTLCGARERMGPSEPREHQGFWGSLSEAAPLEFSPGEALCALCISKRLGVHPLVKARLKLDVPGYPSLAALASGPARLRMALACGLALPRDTLSRVVGDAAPPPPEAEAEARARVKAWLQAIQALDERWPARCWPGNTLPGLGLLEVGPEGLLNLEGTWFDEDAYEPERAWRELGRGGLPPDDFSAALEGAGRAWRRALKATGARPSHYVCALLLDGDGMSAWLNGTHPDGLMWQELGIAREGRRPVHPALHAEISRRLGLLAQGAVSRVVHAHLGRLVYCGGDDVLALLPLETALRCALALSKLFQDNDHLGKKATVSAGLCVQHQRQPLARLLEGAREAEKRAKTQGKDRLVVDLRPRAGAPVVLALPWTDALRALSPITAPEPEAHQALSSALNALRAEWPAIRCHPELLRLRTEALLGPEVGGPQREALLDLCGHKLLRGRLLDLLTLLRFLLREHPLRRVEN